MGANFRKRIFGTWRGRSGKLYSWQSSAVDGFDVTTLRGVIASICSPAALCPMGKTPGEKERNFGGLPGSDCDGRARKPKRFSLGAVD